MTEVQQQLAARLDVAARTARVDWWWCQEWDDLSAAAAGGLVGVLGVIADLLRAGEDAVAITGGVSAQAAVVTAREWVDAGVPAEEVARWLAAGCWRAASAREMTHAGLTANQLLTGDGRPKHLIGSLPRCPVALAVADGLITVAQAMEYVAGRSLLGLR